MKHERKDGNASVESLVWFDAMDPIGPAPAGTRLIHVADRLVVDQ